eukprot:1922590-Amphidinium_carterae.1
MHQNAKFSICEEIQFDTHCKPCAPNLIAKHKQFEPTINKLAQAKRNTTLFRVDLEGCVWTLSFGGMQHSDAYGHYQVFVCSGFLGQRPDIVRHAFCCLCLQPALAGLLAYSTCALNPLECEVRQWRLLSSTHAFISPQHPAKAFASTAV